MAAHRVGERHRLRFRLDEARRAGGEFSQYLVLSVVFRADEDDAEARASVRWTSTTDGECVQTVAIGGGSTTTAACPLETCDDAVVGCVISYDVGREGVALLYSPRGRLQPAG